MAQSIVRTQLPQIAVETVNTHALRISAHVRITSDALTTACRQAGLPLELAELCGGVLASVVDDFVQASALQRTDFERSKRLERILAATQEPTLSALRCAMAASPTNGRACARHWDAICEPGEAGKFAWLLGMDTDNAYRYGKKIEKMRN